MSGTDDDGAPRAAAGITRRWVGIVVLVGVLVVFVVVAAVRGQVMAGDPTAPPVDAAPRVGDSGDYLNQCLVTPADSSRRLTAPLRDLGDPPALN
jgi:hypothetical protein